MLALVWGLQKFWPWVYGRHITVLTDHKPLIFTDSLVKYNQRLARWLLQTKEYNITTTYVPGREQLADHITRFSNYGPKFKCKQYGFDTSKRNVNMTCVLASSLTALRAAMFITVAKCAWCTIQCLMLWCLCFFSTSCTSHGEANTRWRRVAGGRQPTAESAEPAGGQRGNKR